MPQVIPTVTAQGILRTVQELSVLQFVSRMMGLDPLNNLETNAAQAFLGYIDARAREAWEMYDWSELILSEQRAFTNSWNPISTYTNGQIIFDFTLGTFSYYQAIGSVPANTPVTNSTFWLPNPQLPLPFTVPTNFQSTPAGPTVYYSEIGTIFDVTSNDPLQNRHPVPVPYTRSALGLTIWPQYQTWATSPVVLPGGAVTFPYLNLNTIFIRHRQPFPGYATDPWTSGVSYGVGSLVFYNTDTYVCIQATNSFPPSNNLFWSLVPFPYVLSEFVKRSAYSDALAEDGQQEKSAMILGNVNQGTGAYKYLFSEFDKQTIQQGLTQRYTVLQGSSW